MGDVSFDVLNIINPKMRPAIAPQAWAGTLIFGSELPLVRKWKVTKAMSLAHRATTDMIRKHRYDNVLKFCE